MNYKFIGDLYFPELEDQSHRLEVIELILRDDEVAFSFKSVYGAGNSDIWLFDGTAYKKDELFIAENVIGKKYLGSSGDDDGNNIIFKILDFDQQFGDLKVEGTIKYKAQIFNFEGLLELKNKDLIENQRTSIPLPSQVKDKEVRKKRPHNRQRSPFFIRIEIEDLPVHFRAYVKANRVFLSEIKQYQDMLKGLNLAQNFINWTVECQKMISYFEEHLQCVIDGDYKLHVFNDEKKDMAHQLEEILDRQPKEIFFCTDNLTPEQIELINNTDEYFLNIYKNIQKKGYIVYDTWLDTMPLL